MGIYTSIFNVIVQIAGILYLTFALILCLFKTPDLEIYKTYRRSQRFLALNYLVMGVDCLAWLILRKEMWWKEYDPRVDVLDISLFFLSAIFVTFFFGNLLGISKSSTRHLAISLTLWVMNTLIAIGSLFITSALTARLVRGVTEAVFFSYIVYFMYRLLQVYRHRDSMLDQYFTRDMHQFVHWIYKSIVLMIFIAVAATVMLFVGALGNIICQLIVISVNCYIVIGFLNFASRFGSIGEAFKEFEEDANLEILSKTTPSMHSLFVPFGYGYDTSDNTMPKPTNTSFTDNATKTETEAASSEMDGQHMKDKNVRSLPKAQEEEADKPDESEQEELSGMENKVEAQPAPHEDRHTRGALLEKRIEEWKEEKQYLTDQLTINDIAERLGTDRRYLSRFINEHYGINFSRWISEMRINEAKRLMEKEPDEGLEWVALQTGFSSLSYFSKVFSQVVGVSPKKWRASHVEDAQ